MDSRLEVLMVAPMLAELFGSKQPPQEKILCESPRFSAATFPLLLLPEESDLGLLVEAALLMGISLAATPTFIAVLLSSYFTPLIVIA